MLAVSGKDSSSFYSYVVDKRPGRYQKKPMQKDYPLWVYDHLTFSYLHIRYPSSSPFESSALRSEILPQYQELVPIFPTRAYFFVCMQSKSEQGATGARPEWNVRVPCSSVDGMGVNIPMPAFTTVYSCVKRLLILPRHLYSSQRQVIDTHRPQSSGETILLSVLPPWLGCCLRRHLLSHRVPWTASCSKTWLDTSQHQSREWPRSTGETLTPWRAA